MRRAELLVCTLCRHGDGDETAERPGAVLYRRLAEAGVKGVTVLPTECLSNCAQGCTVALRGGAERWSYVYGRLDPDVHVDIIRDGAAKYAAAPNGLTPWRARPDHFRKNCIARIPPLQPAAPELGDA